MKAPRQLQEAIKRGCWFALSCLVAMAVRAAEPATLKLVKTIGLPDVKGRFDHFAVDIKGQRLFVGALGVVNPVTGVLTGSIKLLGHPESFQLEQEGNRIFANVPEAAHVAVIDRQRRTVLEAWLLPNAHANFPMALDERDQRLFVGCRNPARLVVLETTSGRTVTELPISGETDDSFYDAQRKRTHLSCGEGFRH